MINGELIVDNFAGGRRKRVSGLKPEPAAESCTGATKEKQGR